MSWFSWSRAAKAARHESLFTAAMALPSAQERAAYLEQACDGDAALRRRVEGLLRPHDGPGHPPDRLAPQPAPPRETIGHSRDAEYMGTIIAGRYKLLVQIGGGGMGAVFLAEQTQPVQ